MRTKLWKGMLAAVAAVGLLAGTAMADVMDLGFNLNANYSSSNGTSYDTITFSWPSTIPNVTTTHPTGDPLEWAAQVIVNASFVINNFSTLTFADNYYTQGFIVKDMAGNIIFSADLIAKGLSKEMGGGGINLGFDVNLLNITAGTNYVDGYSAIADAFISGGEGKMSISLQIPGGDLEAFLADISRGNPYSNTASGTAVPTSAVPEPATMLLFGAGLLGLSGVARRKMS